MSFRKRTNAYWDKRAAEQLTYVERESLPHLKAIDRAYREARSITLTQVKALYLAYYTAQGWDTAALRSIAPVGDVNRFKEAVRAAGLIDSLPLEFEARLTRLQMVEANLWLESQKAIQAHAAYQTIAHKQTVETAYNYALYTLAKGTGVAPEFAQINTRTIEQILNTRFVGSNYSERIWKNGNRLTRNLRTDLAAAVASGQSQAKTARMMRDRYNVARYQAARLVRTETNHFNTLGSLESYRRVGIGEFIFVATLDTRTSSICQEHDGRRYPLNSPNTPPLHPNCRSTTRAYLGEEYEPDERIMRDPVTGKNRYVGNISYEQWQRLYL